MRRERRGKPEKEEEKPMGGRVGGCGRGGKGDREKGGAANQLTRLENLGKGAFRASRRE